ncbi:unnamed protein product, partial [Closterium sp. Naga37s-1]
GGEERGQQGQQQEGRQGQQQEGQQGRQKEGQWGQISGGEEGGQQQQQRDQQVQEGRAGRGEEGGEHRQHQEVRQGQERPANMGEGRGHQGQQQDSQQGQVGLRVQGTPSSGTGWVGERGREEVVGDTTAGMEGLEGEDMEGGGRARVLGGLGLGRGDRRRQVGGKEDRGAETTREEAQRDQAQQQSVQQQRQAGRIGRMGTPARIPDLTCLDIEKTLMVLVDVSIADPRQQGNAGLRRRADETVSWALCATDSTAVEGLGGGG